MSVNISVSGKTLKECHEQILALANEITGDMKESVKDPIVPQLSYHHRSSTTQLHLWSLQDRFKTNS